MASKRLTPILATIGVGKCFAVSASSFWLTTKGVVTGLYIFKDPVQRAAHDVTSPPSSGTSYAAGKDEPGSKNSASESSSGESVRFPCSGPDR